MSCDLLQHRNEPPLAEILDEPIIAALMERDGVDRDWLEQLMVSVGQDEPAA